MDKQELRRTWRSYRRNGDYPSKHKLVEHYFPFVQNIARKMSAKFNHKVEPDALASYGVEGLYRAIESYDSSHGTKFETYAYIRVRGAMIDGMRADDWVPRSVRLRQSDINDVRSKLETEYGGCVSEEDILRQAGVDPRDYNRNKHKYRPIGFASIETNVSGVTESPDENKKDFNTYLEADNVSAPNGNLLRLEFFSKLMGRNFTQQERKIIYLYYYKDYTMKDIAEKLGMSESRVCQVHQDLLRRLKTRIEVNPGYFGEDVLAIIGSCRNVDVLF